MICVLSCVSSSGGDGEGEVSGYQQTHSLGLLQTSPESCYFKNVKDISDQRNEFS